MILINLWSDLRVTRHVIHSFQMQTVGLLPKMLLKSLISCNNYEILNDFSQGVLSKLQKAKYYAIILDETSDVSDKGHISICFRITMDDLDVQGLSCGFYETTSTTSEELFKIVKDVLSKSVTN